MENRYSIRFNAGGEARKRLVKAIAEYMESFPEYMGAPSFAYRVEGITIDRNGTASFDGEPDPEELGSLMAYLEARGFWAEGTTAAEGAQDTADPTGATEENSGPGDETSGEPEDPAAGSETAESEDAETEGREEGQAGEASGGNAQEEADLMTVSLPRDGFTDTALENLRKIVDSKRTLLMKALGAESLPIETTEEAVSFPWFRNPEGDPTAAAAYAHLISAMCKMAREAKRVTATEKEAESEKYAFRCFLLRLGFVGTQYKHERAVLMRNLSGHSAFRTKAEADAFNEKLKARKAAERAAKSQEAAAGTQEETAQEEERSGQDDGTDLG